MRPFLRSWGAEPIPLSLIHQSQRVQPLKRRAFLDFAGPRLAIALGEIERVIDAA